MAFNNQKLSQIRKPHLGARPWQTPGKRKQLLFIAEVYGVSNLRLNIKLTHTQLDFQVFSKHIQYLPVKLPKPEPPSLCTRINTSWGGPEHMGFKGDFRGERTAPAQGIWRQRNAAPCPQSLGVLRRTRALMETSSPWPVRPRLTGPVSDRSAAFSGPHTFRLHSSTPGPMEKVSHLPGRHEWILCYPRNSPWRR